MNTAPSAEAMIAALGLDRDEVLDRVVARIVDHLLAGVGRTTWTERDPETGEEWEEHISGSLEDRLQGRLASVIAERVDALAEQEIVPRIDALIEGLVLQASNEWGEPKGEPLTLRQYLTRRAEEWLDQPVDYEGKPTSPKPYGGSKAERTRLGHLIDRYFGDAIGTAVAAALGDATKGMAKSLEAATLAYLEQARQRIKIEVKT
jgi:hypothetical protein